MTKTQWLITILITAGVGFLIGGIWTRWLLEDRLLQTGWVLISTGVMLGIWEGYR